MLSSVGGNDQSFRDLGVSDDFDKLKIQPLVASLPTPSPDGIQRDASRVLQRRSHVLAHAVEGNVNIPQPSWEMITRASQDNLLESGPNKGLNKRLYSELTPLPEEAAHDAEQVGSGPLGNVNAVTRKKGRNSEEDGPGKPLRGKTRAAVAASPAKAKPGRTTRAAKEGLGDDDESLVQPRRSSRPQKVARRS